jgi:hypothetical protein
MRIDDPNALYVRVPIADELIRDVDNIEWLARLVKVDAANAAYAAVIQRRKEFDAEED